MAKSVHTTPVQRTAPHWMAEFMRTQENTMPSGGILDAAAFPDLNAISVQLNGAKAAGVTSLTVDALPQALKVNDLLDFGGGKIVRVSARAAKAATTVTIEELQFPLADDAVGKTASTGAKFVPSGTLLGRVVASEAKWGPFADGDTEAYLLPYDVINVNEDPNCELLRHGFMIYPGRLPAYSELSSAAQTFIKNNYDCIFREPVE